MNYLYVGMGGILGALARFCLGTAIQRITVTAFPYGTLTVNLLGSFLLGFITYGSLLKWQLPRPYVLAINTGIIGSFTTFSTFSVDTISLLEKAHYTAAWSYVLVSITGGLALAWLGIGLAHRLFINVKIRGDNQ
ncbi:fluoride efflux transporter CrcB [Desulfotomaculum sp. 1211_IL3151]|uniref:fluoride efflux transporter CrcB n=1 Tax=Desulfotomaculum sp. 1211_IL3151 TaxID=3084055 RepID=UPI002FDA5A4B